MTSIKAFTTILQCTNYAQDNNTAKEWCSAMDYIADQIGIILDKEAQQWVNAPLGAKEKENET